MVSNSPVGICRGAMHRVGITKTITSIENPTTNEEKLCSEEYDDTRREVLRKHPWNSAKKRVKITADSNTPEFGYANKYRLPADFVRVVQIGSGVTDVLYTQYAIEGGFLLLGYSPDDSASDTDPAVLNLVYIFDQTDVNKWDPLLKQIVKLAMALKLFPLHKKGSLQRDIQAEFDAAMPKGTSVDGQDQPPIRIESSRIIRSRTQGNGLSNSYAGHYF